MVKSNFQLANLCGTVYRQGNLLFTNDGNSVISPLGNRVGVFDLVNNKSKTFAFENRKNIAKIALSPDANILLSVDEDGRALMVNFKRGTVLSHFNFKAPVRDIKFSPDGKYIAVSHGAQVHVWQTPSHLVREFAPFVLHRKYTGHYDDVLSITWSQDSKCFITTSKDMTARLFTLHPVEGFRPKTFAGHKDHVMGAYFSGDGKTIYTVSRDGALFTWRAKPKEDMDEDDDAEDAENDLQIGTSASAGESNAIANTRWAISERNYFNQNNTKVTSVAFHVRNSLLVVGFSSGIFGLYELPNFANIHTLSISQEKITSVTINSSGEWLAFGATKLGQLLVWEWQSESYVLKQQGHYFDMNSLAFSSDGQTIVTGGDDGKLKVWNSVSGFCHVTFTDHSSAISAVEITKQNSVLFSASLDGTVRAFDLIRYRNFRTFLAPNPVQFTCLAVDPSGEIVVAGGSGEAFEVYVWSVQTGKLLDVMVGHEGPISGIAFSPSGERMATSSWDGTARIWDVYARSSAVEPFNLTSDGLSVAYRPDGQEVAVSTLNGQIIFWNVRDGKQTGLIEGRKDIAGGRSSNDRTTAANSPSGKYFTSLAYTADGSCIIAGGNSKNVCLYDIREGVLLKKWEISQNLSLEGTLEFLDSRNLTDAGPRESIDDRGELSDLEDRIDTTLPGARNGDMSRRKYRPEARTKCVRFSPTGRSWAAASTDGLLIYSLDSTVSFDPFDLDIDITPETTLETLAEKEYLKALVMAFRLNEHALIHKVWKSVKAQDIRLLIRELPSTYLERLVRFVAAQMEDGPHIEVGLRWMESLLIEHGKYFKDNSGECASALREAQRALKDAENHVARM